MKFHQKFEYVVSVQPVHNPSEIINVTLFSNSQYLTPNIMY